MEFKDKLKELRRAGGYTQEALGEKIHVSRSAVAKWELGLGMPSEDSAEALCKIFSVGREELFPNSAAEAIIVEKNKKIRGIRLFTILISSIALVIIITLSALIAMGEIRENDLANLSPRLESVNVVKWREGEILTVDEGLLLFSGEEYTVEFVFSGDPALFEGNYVFNVEFPEGFAPYIEDSTRLRIVKTEKSDDGNVEYVTLRTEMKILDPTVTSFLPKDVKFKDRRGERYTQIAASPIKIVADKKQEYDVTFKFLGETVYKTTVRAGENLRKFFADTSKEYSIGDFGTVFLMLASEILEDSPYADELILSGFVREDGKSFDDPVFSDVTVTVTTENCN